MSKLDEYAQRLRRELERLTVDGQRPEQCYGQRGSWPPDRCCLPEGHEGECEF